MISRLLGHVVTALMLLLVLEGLLRFAGCSPQPTINEFHPRWGWAKRPGAKVHRETSEFEVTFEINDKGLRNPPIPYEKPDGVTRILFVGDSFTLGYTVEDHDLFLRRFERAMRARGHRVEAINGGTEGYSNDQELLWLMDEGLKYRPDYVVFLPYLNDIFWNTQDHYTDKPKPLYRLRDGELEAPRERLKDPGATPWWESHTALGNAWRMWHLARLLPRTTVAGRTVYLEDAPLLRRPPARIEEAWRLTEALVARFADVVREAGARPLALIVPNKWEIHSDEPPATLGGLGRESMAPSGPTDRYLRACEAAGFLVVDPRPELRRRAEAGQRLYHRKDWHWNAAGNEAVAQALVERFLAEDLLGPGEPIAGAEDSADDPEASSGGGGLSAWIWIPLLVWIVLGAAYATHTQAERPPAAFLAVGLLVLFVTLLLKGVHLLLAAAPPAFTRWFVPLLVLALIVFLAYKVGRRLGVLVELYSTFLRRGHWYLLPMLVVMVSIGMLLVVAATSPFVAPFIYTLF